MSPTGSFMNLVQEPIHLNRSQALEQQPFQSHVEHIVPYQDVLYGLVSYPLMCPLSRTLQVIEDIGSPVS
jgi:hypothetical protein